MDENNAARTISIKVRETAHRRLSTFAAQKGVSLSDGIDLALDAAEATKENPARKRMGFDERLDLIRRKLPIGMLDAFVYVHDTVDQAWLAALDIFGPEATPDLALKIYSLVDAHRAQIVPEIERGAREEVDELLRHQQGKGPEQPQPPVEPQPPVQPQPPTPRHPPEDRHKVNHRGTIR